MEYLTSVLCLALLAGLVFCIGYPLLQQPAGAPVAEGSKKHLLERREQLLAAIKEIEFDQAMGKLPEGEYQRLRQQLEAEAVHVLHQLDQLDGQSGLNALRSRIEKDVLALRQPQKNRCPACGAPRRQADRFCSRCGARFEGDA